MLDLNILMFTKLLWNGRLEWRTTSQSVLSSNLPNWVVVRWPIVNFTFALLPSSSNMNNVAKLAFTKLRLHIRYPSSSSFSPCGRRRRRRQWWFLALFRVLASAILLVIERISCFRLTLFTSQSGKARIEKHAHVEGSAFGCRYEK